LTGFLPGDPLKPNRQPSVTLAGCRGQGLEGDLSRQSGADRHSVSQRHQLGLTYLNERFKNVEQGGNIQLQGVPRSLLAEYAEAKH